MLEKIAQRMGRAINAQTDWDMVSLDDSVYVDHRCPFCTHPPYLRLGNLRRHYISRHT